MALILMVAYRDRAVRDAAECLAREGHDVFTEQWGYKGLELALARPPDILLVDMLISGMDGFQICQEVARKYPDRHVPTIMRTHVGGTGEPWRGWGAQGTNWVDAYVMRGDSHWQIVLGVEQLLNRSVQPREGPVSAPADPPAPQETE